MPKVVFDYSKCTGIGECVNSCPVEVLEVSANQRWCKPVDDKVANKEAVKEFHEKVENQQNAVNIKIENELPDCIVCRVCETVCPNQAITVKEE
jgi:ferredoxin